MIWSAGSGRPTLVEIGEYNGESEIGLSATQLSVPTSRANRVLNGWIEFFEAGPSPIVDLRLTSRTPSRLFDSLRNQTQLRRLTVKWGNYSDLTVLEGMQSLEALSLGSAMSVTDLTPLAKLSSLRTLTLEGAERLTDYSPLGALHKLEKLAIRESLNGGRTHADSLDFVRGLRSLKQLTFVPRVDSLDYSPLLDVRHIEDIYVQEAKGMSPTMVDLEWSVPGIAAHIAEQQRRAANTRWVSRPSERTERPTHAQAVEAIAEIDKIWVELLDGKRTRLETILWGRNADAPRLGPSWIGLTRMNQLVGYPWDVPPDKEILALTRWLEEWRADARAFAADPDGEPRRVAVRMIKWIAKNQPNDLRNAFDRYVAEGLLGPDDEVTLGIPARDGRHGSASLGP